MPRPSKHVSPNTLGGRLRASREAQSLSLTEVSGGQYSTSLISQIERNVVNPSEDTLRFLCQKLGLSYEDLIKLPEISAAKLTEEDYRMLKQARGAMYEALRLINEVLGGEERSE